MERSARFTSSRRAGAVVTVAALIAIAWLTLTPSPPTQPPPPTCIFCGAFGGVDFVLNVVLFVPLGAGLVLLGRPARDAMLAGLFATMVVEGLQWRVIPGRDASLGDLLANTLGAILGAWLVPRVVSWSRTGGRRALPLLRVTGALAAATVSLASVLLVPATPDHRQFVLWTAPRPHLDLFPDTLRTANLNGRDLRGGDRLQPGFLFNGAARSTVVTAVTEGPGGVTRRQALIVSVADPLQEGLFLGQWGNGLIFRTYVTGSRLRLRPVLARLEGAFVPGSVSATADALVTINARSHRRAIVLSRVRGESRLEAVLPRTVGLAWTLLLPWDVAIDTSWWFANALFLGTLIAPVTFLAMRVRQRRVPDESTAWEAGWPLLLVLGALVVSPALAGLSPVGRGEWAGVLAGGAMGVILARLTRTGIRP